MIEHESGAIRGEVRLAGYCRQSHGLYLPDKQDEDGPSAVIRQLSAWTLLLPLNSGFTHITGAWLRRWWMPQLPELVPVFAAGPGPAHPRRAGLIYSRFEPPEPFEPLNSLTQVHGLPVVAAEEVLLRAARDLGLLDLTVMVSSALRTGEVDQSALAAICGSGRPGVRNLRTACSWSDARYESPYEVLLALFHQLAGIAVKPQHEIRDDKGRFVARGDLLVIGTNSIHEYDGEVHEQRGQRVRDLRRDRRLLDTPYVRRGFVAEDLFRHSLAMLQELDAAVGRPHRPSRLALWRRHLAESTYSRAGRQRLQNRWLRSAERIDWTRTA